MRRYADVKVEFSVQYDALRPKPQKYYIAYSNGNSKTCSDYHDAKEFSPKGLIETIEPDIEELRAWRRDKYDIDARVAAQWKRELFEEGGMSDVVSEKIFDFAGKSSEDRDGQAELFIDLTWLVSDCIKLSR